MFELMTATGDLHILCKSDAHWDYSLLFEELVMVLRLNEVFPQNVHAVIRQSVVK